MGFSIIIIRLRKVRLRFRGPICLTVGLGSKRIRKRKCTKWRANITYIFLKKKTRKKDKKRRRMRIEDGKSQVEGRGWTKHQRWGCVEEEKKNVLTDLACCSTPIWIASPWATVSVDGAAGVVRKAVTLTGAVGTKRLVSTRWKRISRRIYQWQAPHICSCSSISQTTYKPSQDYSVRHSPRTPWALLTVHELQPVLYQVLCHITFT